MGFRSNSCQAINSLANQYASQLIRLILYFFILKTINGEEIFDGFNSEQAELLQFLPSNFYDQAVEFLKEINEIEHIKFEDKNLPKKDCKISLEDYINLYFPYCPDKYNIDKFLDSIISNYVNFLTEITKKEENIQIKLNNDDFYFYVMNFLIQNIFDNQKLLILYALYVLNFETAQIEKIIKKLTDTPNYKIEINKFANILEEYLYILIYDYLDLKDFLFEENIQNIKKVHIYKI
ncbi:hypothetical protein GVAV_001288 [Gurleya vavrai]